MRGGDRSCAQIAAASGRAAASGGELGGWSCGAARTGPPVRHGPPAIWRWEGVGKSREAAGGRGPPKPGLRPVRGCGAEAVRQGRAGQAGRLFLSGPRADLLLF